MNYNCVTLGGRICRDIEMRYLPSGVAVAQFSIAINRTWMDKQTNEKREEVSFVDCEAFGRTAETINQYLSKGRGIFLWGRLKQDTWENAEGQKRSKLKTVVDGFQFIDKGDGGNQGQQATGGYQQPAQGQRRNYGRDGAGQQQPASGGGQGLYGGGEHVATDEDDIPF